MKRDFVKTLLKFEQPINGRTVLTKNSQVTIVVNKFSVAKITHHLFRFQNKLSYVIHADVVRVLHLAILGRDSHVASPSPEPRRVQDDCYKMVCDNSGFKNW